MKKMIMILMMVFTVMSGLFAGTSLLPKDKLDGLVEVWFTSCGLDYEKKPQDMQWQVGYIADTWEDVYKKTGIGKYGWEEGPSGYLEDCTIIEQQHYAIIKCSLGKDFGWICFECPGDGSVTVYSTYVEE